MRNGTSVNSWSSTGAVALPILWGLSLVGILFAWNFALSFFQPGGPPQATGTPAAGTEIGSAANSSERSANRVPEDYWSTGSAGGTVGSQRLVNTRQGTSSGERGSSITTFDTHSGSSYASVTLADDSSPKRANNIVASKSAGRRNHPPSLSSPYRERTAASQNKNSSQWGSPDSDFEDRSDGFFNENFPIGDYQIVGQVVNEDGQPASGIGVVATVRRLFDETPAIDLAGGVLERRTQANADGYFQFAGLADGEYQIKTVISRNYPAVSSTIARTGAGEVKLVAVQQSRIWITGFVENTSGESLAGVEITPITQSDHFATTGQDGSYRLRLTVKKGSIYPIRVWAPGYRQQTVSVGAQEAESGQGITRDVVLEPERPPTFVLGTVTSRGSPVAGERVYLKSSQTKRKYDAVTDENGAFSMNAVEIGNDYILWVSPQGPYRLYRKNNVAVTAQGLSLDISLEAEGVGNISGQMVDQSGNPIPNYSLSLRSEGSTKSPLTVTSDHNGQFVLANVPMGQLSIATSSLPIFKVSGIQLAEGETKEVQLILDIGDYDIRGLVQDDQGNPVPAANVLITWVHRDSGVTHESLHKTVSNVDGHFEFNQLGPGERTLTVAAPGFEAIKLPYDVGAENDLGQILQVQLEEDSSS